MKGWGAAITMATALAAASAWAASDDKARTRSGGGGSSSSSAGGRHHSGGGSSSRSSGSSESATRSGGSHSTPTEAQLRHPRAGTGSGFRHRGYGSRSYWYDPYWSGWYGWNGWSGWYWRPYGWYSPYYYSGFYGYQPYPHRYGYSSYRAGSLRVLVQPSETRVYVDGYYAGVADDFDGLFQRLHLAPGRHDISLKLEGYRTHQFKVYVPYDRTIKLHHKMARGEGPATSDEVMAGPGDHARYEGDRDRDADYDRDREAGYGRDREADQTGERALVSLDVRPGDASIYVDGAFRGTGRELRRLRLTPGRHRIEVVRPGYRTVEREVEVRGGQDVDVSIELEKS